MTQRTISHRSPHPRPDPPRRLLRDAVRSLAETLGVIALWPLHVLLRRGLAALGLRRRLRSNDRRIFEDWVLRTLAGKRRALDILSIGVRRPTRSDEALAGFEAHRFDGIGATALALGGANRHRFEFYRKKKSGPPAD